MVCKKSTEVDLKRRRLQKKLSMQRAREKIKANPTLYEVSKKKERERWQKRKEEGKIVGIAYLSNRKQRLQRKKWRHWAKNHRKEAKRISEATNFLDNNTPPNSPTTPTNNFIVPSTSKSRSESGRKVARRNREKLRKETELYKAKCEKLTKRLNKYKQRLVRLEKKATEKSECTPRKTVNTLLENYNKNKKHIRTKLLFGEVLTRQVTDNIQKVKSNKDKAKMISVFTGKLISKYKFITNVRSMTFLKIKRFKGYHAKKAMEKEVSETRRAVINFFEKDQNSRLCPGKKDTITKYKIKRQKRLLNDTMRNLHKAFIKEHQQCKLLGYSTFCKMRPYWVVKPNVTSRNTCLCKIHENIRLIISKLTILKLISQNSPSAIVQSLTCFNKLNELNERCLERKCILCKQKTLIFNTEDQNLDEIVSYYQWVVKRVSVKVKGKEKVVQKTIKEAMTCAKKDLMHTLQDLLPKYMIHISNINHQYKVTDDIKKALPFGSVFVHMDFSENYQCKYSSEIQSAHFGGSKSQITLHTIVMYYRDYKDDKVKQKSYATLSENCRHDPVAIAAHLEPIFKEIKALIPDLNMVHFLSDGVCTQYKNKLMFQLFGSYIASKLLPKEMMWHFTESGHGKGAPDGVGGCLKRTADTLVAQGTDIPDLTTLVAELKKTCSGINVLTIDESLIDILDRKRPTELETFKGTTKIHQLTWNKNSLHINARRLSCIECETNDDCKHYGLGNIILCNNSYGNNVNNRLCYNDVYSSDSDKSVEDEEMEDKTNKYVVVEFSTKKTLKHFVGLVIEENFETSVVKFLKMKSDLSFTFPDKDDISVIDSFDIKKFLNPPKMNRRQNYVFDLKELSNFKNTLA